MLAIMVFAGFLALDAQDFSRYNYFHEEAVKLMNQGKLVEAKAKLENIKKTCKGAIPDDNDLDALILRCIVLTPSARYLQFDAHDTEEQCVAVTTNMGQFKVVSNSDWCLVRKEKSFIYVGCKENTLPKARTAVVSLSLEGKVATITVEQQGGDVRLAVQPDSVGFPNGTNVEKVYVSTNADAWAVDSVPYWIEVHTQADTLTLKSSANKNAVSRETSVYVSAGNRSIPVKVYQAGSDTLVLASCNEIVFPNEEDTKSFAVTCNLAGWEVESPDEWIEAWADGDSVRVMAYQNLSLFSRHGRVSIGAGKKTVEVLVHQRPLVSTPPAMESEIGEVASEGSDEIKVNSFPEGLKVIVHNDDHTVSTTHYTPFTLPVDYMHHTLQLGFEKKEVFINEKQQDITFEPGLRFATFTWAPKEAIGLMSGYVAAHSWGAYAHFQVNTPFAIGFDDDKRWLSGYNMTFGPVFQPRRFPYVGAYAGIGLGCYVGEPHVGFDYEAGIMGFYKHFILSVGFHTSRISSSVKTTSFMVGVGGYLKRYYDPELGYCASDSRRWTSLNYVFRPKEKGRGIMVGDVGSGRVRAYFKGMYLQPEVSDSLSVKNLEAGMGLMFTPVNGIIDMCVGVSAAANISGLEKRFQGVGVELGTVLNVWRIPLTVFLHEVDLFGDRHFCVDFGIGFHLGKFGKSNSTYQ